jgi:phosphatidylserine/phosphatidylglycerophosphate/cardiolipin synthase-like enzyme
MKRAPFRYMALLLVGWSLALVELPAAQKHQATVEVYFSPKGGCTEAIVNALGAAKQTVLVQAYSFTSKPIFAALLAAQKRGVKVQLVLDRSNLSQKSSEADDAVDAGVPVLIDSKHEIAHNKIIIVDGDTVITGSFNFSHNAEENNAENLVLIRGKEVAAKYTDNWKDHARHSEPYAKAAKAKEKKDEQKKPGKSTLWPFR